MPDAQNRPLPGEPGYQAPATGLVNAATPDVGTVTGPTATPATATNATAQGYDPSAFGVKPEQTVQGQIAGIIDQNSPLMQQAITRANQKMNERGLLNSSQAISAGQSALYDAALPIATQDANTYNAAMTNTANAQNQAKQFGAGAINTASLQNAQLATGVSQGNAAAFNSATAQTANAANVAALQAAQNSTTLSVADKQAATSKYNADLAAATQVQMQGIDNAFKTQFQTADTAAKVQLENLSNTTKTDLANIQANYQTLMQTSASATTTFQTGMSMIQNVVADTTIDAASKANLINGYLGWMKQQMNMLGNVNGVDLSQLLDFGTVTA